MKLLIAICIFVIMQDLVKIWSLVKKDLTVDLREIYAFASVFLFVVTCVFIVFKAYDQISLQIWVVTYWVILIFVSINAVLKSFKDESGSSRMYYYSLLHPLHVITAKIIYNFIFVMILAIILWLILVFFSFNPFDSILDFSLLLLCSSYGFSVVFTFVSALSQTGGNNSTLLSVLGMPLIIPILLISVKLSFANTGMLDDTSLATDFSLLLGINLLLTGICMLLFSILWKA